MESVRDEEPKYIADKIKPYLEEQVEDDNFSGALLITKGDDVEFEYSLGLANRRKGVPITQETQFNLGSINKLFTAVAIAQLVEKEKLSFSDNVGKFLPDYPNDTVRDQITIEQLLTHTSGMGSFIDIEHRDQFLAKRKELKSIKDVVNLFKNRPLPHKQGEYHYSPDGYEVLGLVIESTSGQDYYDYVREHIYQVANMQDTDCYELDLEDSDGRIAVGYTNRDPLTGEQIEGGRVDNIKINLIKGTAGGSGYSTTKDLVKFSQALLGNRLLSAEMTAEILKPRIDLGSKNGQHKYQGYGFQTFEIEGVKRVGHAGRFAGVNARFDMYLELGYTVVVLSNYDPPAAFNVAEKISEVIVNPKLS